MTKIRTVARALGLAGLIAVAVVGASGCNNPASGVDRPQTAESSTTLADGKVEYSITGVELHKQSSFVGEDSGQVGQVVAIRWHARNVGSTDAWACPIMKVYQNKRVLFVDTAEDIDDPVFKNLLPVESSTALMSIKSKTFPQSRSKSPIRMAVQMRLTGLLIWNRTTR